MNGEVHLGDAVTVLATLPSCSVQLAYVDPPFFTGKDWGEFDDRWSSMSAYVGAMRAIAEGVHRVLVEGGSLYWQGDERAIHRVWCMLEDVFGCGCRRHIAWLGFCESGFKSKVRNWVRQHDSVLYFVKGDKALVFNTQWEPHTEVRERRYNRVDEDGRRYLWHSSDKRRCYADATPGRRAGSVWRDFFVTTSKERTGYPTQKPLALLERIVRASSDEGGLVLDPCCGSGTTLVAAERLGRRWVGIDRNGEAVRIAEGRLRAEREGAPLIDR